MQTLIVQTKPHDMERGVFQVIWHILKWSTIAPLVCMLVAGTLLIDRKAFAETNKERFLVGFAKETFFDVNQNDAEAALKIWLANINKELDISTDMTPRFYNDVQSMKRALIAKKVDALTLSAMDYVKLQPLLDENFFLAPKQGKSTTTEYILLVSREGKIRKIEDLQGVKLGSVPFGLAPIWLDTLLMEAGFPPASDFCRIKEYPKVSAAILPVFFHQIDACVVDRNGFKTMCELNPQLGKQLVILATSPPLVPFGMTFRRGYNGTMRELITEKDGLNAGLSSAPGQQIMTLFKINGYTCLPVSCLDESLTLLDRHQRLLDKIHRRSIKQQ